MRWLEVIRVRSPTLPDELVATVVTEVRPEDTSRGALLSVRVLRDILGSPDIAIHLWWKGPGPAERSREGLHMARWLRQHAPTQHDVWVEEGADLPLVENSASCESQPKRHGLPGKEVG